MWEMNVDTARHPQSPLRYKRSSLLNGSLLNPFRSRVPTEQHSRSSTPIRDIRSKYGSRLPNTIIAERREDEHVLISSTSEIFIARLKAEAFFAQFKHAQGAYLDGDLDLCHHRCTELLESSSLHLDTRIETIQLMATITPLATASEHLSAALHLLDLAVTRGGAESHMEALMGLRITTLDIMARLEKEMLRLGPAADKGSTKGGRGNSVRSEANKRMGSYTTKAKMIYRPLVSLLHRSTPLHEF
ncbi:hypothetical protein BUE80_DR011008 [Diplocarpon rosae]|nr:hypothetical protein BUE80_DR011008 [Diplocarpon rosae]